MMRSSIRCVCVALDYIPQQMCEDHPWSVKVPTVAGEAEY